MNNESDIRGQISYYNNQISDCEYGIVRLQTEIEQLEDLSLKVVELKKSLASSQVTRLSANEKINGLDFNKKLTYEYCNGTRNLLTGDRYTNAESGLTTAKQKIEERMETLRQQMSEKQSNIYYYQDIINDLYYQLSCMD